MTVAVALLLAAVTVLPLLAEARHEASGPVAHAVLAVAGHDLGSHDTSTDELVHHAQWHAQGMLPTVAKASATLSEARVASAVANDPDRDGEAVRGPFEPPRA